MNKSTLYSSIFIIAFGSICLMFFSCSQVIGDQKYSEGSSTDQDGNEFEYIKYGAQVWSIDDAQIVTYRDGTQIPKVSNSKEWESLNTGAWCYVDNDPTRGKLYNWYAVMGIHDDDENTPNKEFAPEGWRVPNEADWLILEKFLIKNGYNYDGSVIGNKIAKSMASQLDWYTTADNGAIGNQKDLNNKSGFNASPKGGRFYNGRFMFSKIFSFFWTSNDDIDLCFFLKDKEESLMNRRNQSKRDGYSVRLIKD
jgi:uncharacterized protein (TIGR02145 family)